MKILSKIKLIQSKLSVSVNKHPFLSTILILVLANVAILMMAACFAMLIDRAEYFNYLVALVNVLQWMIIPGSVLLPESLGIRILAVIVFIVGLVLFSGTIIALTTTHLKHYIEHKSNAKGKLKLSNHIVVLNYNERLPAMFQAMSYNEMSDTVLILSHMDKKGIKSAMQHQSLIATVNPLSKTNLVIRQGDANSTSELSDICLNSAKAIFIAHSYQTPKDETNMATVDLLITVASQKLAEHIHIVVETNTQYVQGTTQNIIASLPILQDKDIFAFCPNELIGQFLAMSILSPLYVQVVYDLLSFKKVAVYDIDCNMTLQQYLHSYTLSIPLYSSEGKLFVLAKGSSDLQKLNTKPILHNLKIQYIHPIAPKFTCFVYGQNDKYDSMVKALKAMDGSIVCKVFEEHQMENFVNELGVEQPRIAVVLSSDKNDDNVLLALVALNQRYGTNPPFEILVQIKDPNKQENIQKFGIKSIIVSSKVASFFAMQNLLKRQAQHFFATLLSNNQGNFDLCINQASEIFDLYSMETRFESLGQFVRSTIYSTNQTIVPIGFAMSDGNVFFCEKLDSLQPWILKATDNLIYLKYR